MPADPAPAGHDTHNQGPPAVAGFEGGSGLLPFVSGPGSGQPSERGPNGPSARFPIPMRPALPPLLRPLACLSVAVALLGLAGCKSSTAPKEPGAAVEGLAQAIRDDDLVRYSRLSLPPALHARMEARWKAKIAAAPPPKPKEIQDYDHWMGRLTAPGAEKELIASTEPKLAKLEKEIGAQWPLMQATAKIFVNGVVQANDSLSPAQKSHFSAVGGAITSWLTPERLTDRSRAKQAIGVVVDTARDLELPTLADARQLEMIPALEKAGVGLRGLKALGKVYGFDANAALDDVEAEVASVEGDTALVDVTYPLLGQKIAFEMELVQREGRWYPADAVRDAEKELAQPLPAAVAIAPGVEAPAAHPVTAH